MAKGKRYAKRSRRRPWWATALVALAAAAAWGLQFLPEAAAPPAAPAPAASGGTGLAEGLLQVYFLDVGQGDSELLCLPGGEHILIDAGTPSTGEELVDELQRLGADRLDLVVGTHPHADHIGGMAEVISSLDIGEVVLPRVPDNQTPTTKTYENMLESIAEKNLQITPAAAGTQLWNKDGVVIETLAPGTEEYGDLNNYSLVLRLTYGEDAFLFTGDAEEESEEHMLARGAPVAASVLKCGHHGSSTSTSDAFLQQVSPSAAVISCGADNDYGHPHQETLDKLEAAGVQVYRTDTQGTILAQSEGSGVTFSHS